MKIDVINKDSKDVLDAINYTATPEDLAKLRTQSIAVRVRTNPIETIKSLREHNVITD